MSSTVSWFVLILLLYGCPQEKLSGTNLFLCLMSSTQCNTVNNNVYLNTVINYCRQTTYKEMHKNITNDDIQIFLRDVDMNIAKYIPCW